MKITLLMPGKASDANEATTPEVKARFFGLEALRPGLET
jgi:hypothetical protein